MASALAFDSIRDSIANFDDLTYHQTGRQQTSKA